MIELVNVSVRTLHETSTWIDAINAVGTKSGHQDVTNTWEKCHLLMSKLILCNNVCRSEKNHLTHTA